jgi:tripartite-type tricarboxylate transporter receptor subunit TctC
MKKHRPLPRVLTLLGLLALAPLSASAQNDTGRQIRWIVPYQAGSSPDTQSRIVGEALSKVLEQPIIIDNKPGAAGNLGAQLARRAPADGNTWIYSGSPMVANMRLYKMPGFDAMKDFTHVAMLARSDSALVVDARSDIHSVADLVQRLRAKPGTASYGSGGIGTPSHLTSEWLLRAAQVKAEHVPYKGAAAITMAVHAEEVLFAMPIVGVAVPQVQAGKLRALAVTGTHRNPRLPNVPTLAESGFPDITLVSFGGISVPAGTPAPVVQRLESAMRQVLAMPAVRERIEATGSEVGSSGSQAYTAVLAAEIAATERMMRTAALEAQ